MLNLLSERTYALLVEPFVLHPFLMRALVACGALSLGCGAVGSFLTLRRMGLVADALSHGLFPGVAIAFLLTGFQMGFLSIGGALTATLLALLAERMTYSTALTKDSVFSVLVFFSTAIALFVLALFGNYTDVMHILMGNVLALSHSNLLWLGGTATLTLFALALLYRPLVLKSFDPHFFRMTHARHEWVDTAFLLLVTLNTVCAFQALGSLLALGLLLIPAITARLWTRHIWTMCLASTGLALLSSAAGILISYYGGYPTGPLIILVATTFYSIACLKQWKTKRYKSLRFILMWVPLLLLPVYLYKKTPTLIRPQVVVSFTVLEDFVNILTEGKVRTYTLVGPDQDPHQFEPTPDDMAKLAEANLVILNGLHLENHWLPKFLAMQTQVPVVNAADNVEKRFFNIGNQTVPDPHAWHDVQQAKVYVQTIAQALIQTWPNLSTIIKNNTVRYLEELDELERWIRKRLERLTHNRRHVITTHDGFGYFERAYGIHFLTPLGPSTTADPSPADIKKVLISAVQHDVRGIFFENMVPRQHITMLADATRLTVGGTLYSDALSSASHANTYVGMMRHNVRTLLAHM